MATTAIIFNNNLKFHHKNSASPSLCIYAKKLEIKVPENQMPRISRIVNDFNYKEDDFKFFLKIWPNNINTIDYKGKKKEEKEEKKEDKVRNKWEQIKRNWIDNWSDECKALTYESKVYHLFDNLEEKHYTVTPLLSDGFGIKMTQIAYLFNYENTNPNYTLFEYIFCKWLIDPRQPSNIFNYDNELKEITNLTEYDKKLFGFMVNNVTFNCIITPIIPEAETMHKVIINVSSYPDNLKKQIMEIFCKMFTNIVKGIKNLKDRGIAHNDLHSGNIFVQKELPDGKRNTFIYDYDRSYVKYLGDNPSLTNDPCQGYCKGGNCNIYDYWMDFHKILHYIFIGVSKNLKLLFLSILTNKKPDITFINYIRTLQLNSFFINPNTNCCWYFDTTTEYYKNKTVFETLYIDYNTLISRLESYNPSVSFGFINPILTDGFID